MIGLNVANFLLAAGDAAGHAPAAESLPWSPGPLQPVITVLLGVTMAALVVGICFCLYRIMRGPHLADRVLGADALTIQVVGLVLVLTIHLRTTAFFDVALVVAIIGFASSLAFAQYIGSRLRED